MKTMDFWKKYLLTIEEASVYFHIGETRLRQLVEENLDKPFLLFNGNRILIKRRLFEEYIDNVTTI